MSRRSWRGPTGPECRTRPRSTVSCCGVTWRTWPRAATRAGPSPARRRRFAAISLGSAATSLIAVDPSRRLSAPAGEARLAAGARCHRSCEALSSRRSRRRRATTPPADRPPARRRPLGAPLRQRAAGRRALRARAGRRRPAGRSVTVWGKGDKQRRVPMSRAGRRGRGQLRQLRAAGLLNASSPAGVALRQSARAADDAAGRAPGSRPALPCADASRTRSVTPTPPTSSTVARTCASSRSCSATPA